MSDPAHKRKRSKPPRRTITAVASYNYHCHCRASHPTPHRAGFALLTHHRAVNAYPRAGPKEELHFEPREVRAAIVNCGGLCPGLNNVIKGIVEHLSYG